MLGATSGISDIAPESGAAASTDMTTPTEMTRGSQNAGGRRAAMQGRGIGNLPPLKGLPQIVGLALGSPEFQRR